jgi:hypothetical protein
MCYVDKPNQNKKTNAKTIWWCKRPFIDKVKFNFNILINDASYFENHHYICECKL